MESSDVADEQQQQSDRHGELCSTPSSSGRTLRLHDMDPLPAAHHGGPSTSYPTAELFPELICPITQQIMVDPVILTESGQTYERSAIQQWLYRGNKTDPLTRKKISHTGLSTNYAVKNIIAAFHARARVAPLDPQPRTPALAPSTPSPLHSVFSTESHEAPTPSSDPIHIPPSPLTPLTPLPQPLAGTPHAALLGTSPPASSPYSPAACSRFQPSTPPSSSRHQPPSLSDRLELAAAHGDAHATAHLLQQVPAAARPQAALHALNAAAANGHSAVVALLVKAGATGGTHKRAGSGPLPLHTAALNGWHEVTEVLLTHGVDLHTPDPDLRRTALHVAAAMGHASVVATLTRHGALLDLPDADGATPLLLAAKAGHAAAVAALAAAGADPTATDASGLAALHHACRAADAPVIRALLAAGADPNGTEHGDAAPAPLCLAAAAGGSAAAAAVTALLDAGADIDAIDGEHCNALLRAVHAGDAAMVALLAARGADAAVLQQLGHDVRLPHLEAVLPALLAAPRGGRGLLRGAPWSDWNPLVDAAAQGCAAAVRHVLEGEVEVEPPVVAAAVVAAVRAGVVDALEALLAAGAGKAVAAAEPAAMVRAAEAMEDAEVAETLLRGGVLQSCVTAAGAPVTLHRHAAAGRAPVMKALLDAAVADPHAVHGERQRTALFHCATAAAAAALLDAGAHAGARDTGGCTPLSAATDPDVASLLLDTGADPADADAAGRTALHTAAAAGNLPKLQVLLCHPSAQRLLSTPDAAGSLPLHAAVTAPTNSVACLHALLLADVDAADSVNARDVAGRTPLLLAVEGGHQSAMRYLVAHGADVAARDARQRSPTSAAALAMDLRALRFLTQHGGAPDAPVAADALVKAIEAGEEGVAMALMDGVAGAEGGALELGPLLPAACLHRLPRLVSRMLQAGADPNAVDASGRTALLAVCQVAAQERADVKCVTLLLQAGATTHAPALRGSTPLHLAAQSGDLDLLLALLPYTPVRAFLTPDGRGANPLLLTTIHSHPALTSTILSHLSLLHRRPSSPTHRPGYGHTLPTPSSGPHSAPSSSAGPIPPPRRQAPSRKVLAALANSRCPSGLTPLHHLTLHLTATADHHPTNAARAALLALLRAGANPCQADANGNTPLHFAVAVHGPALQLMLPHAGHLDPLNAASQTPLQLAAALNTPHSWAAVALLLSAGAAARAPAADAAAGRTLLHVAAATPLGCAATLQMLRQGADAAACDRDGRTAADVAADAGCAEVLDVLRRHAAAAP